MIKIAIAGGAGRMGKALIQAVVNANAEQLTLTGVTEVGTSSDIGEDAGILAGMGKTLGVPVSQNLTDCDFDVLIDFTTPQASLSNIEFCQLHRKKIVIGTTGFTESEKARISHVANDIPVVFAPNMSIGVNTCFALLQQAAKLLGRDADIKIIEAHHRYKKDLPSGTALKMGQVVSKVLDNMGVFKTEAIGVNAIRAGDIVGEHTVMFALDGERVEITHKASSRQAFAKGAVKAAKWLASQNSGLYSMEDVLF